MEFESREELTRYTIAKIHVLMQEYGEQAVADALDKELGSAEYPESEHLKELGALSESSLVLAETYKLLVEVDVGDLLRGAARKGTIPKRSIPRLMKLLGGGGAGFGSMAGAAVGKKVDQDVRIADQSVDLKVKDEDLHDLISQTNALLKTTNDLLSGAGDALKKSDMQLDDLNYSIDDMIARSAGTSVSDVRTDQEAQLQPGATFPEEEEEEPLPRRGA